MQGDQRIIISRTDSIGDVVLTLPAIEALAKHFPSAQIDVLVAKNMKDLLMHNPYISNVLCDFFVS